MEEKEFNKDQIQESDQTQQLDKNAKVKENLWQSVKFILACLLCLSCLLKTGG